jgi:hypothetical protein
MVSSSIDRNKILIGEPIRLTLNVSLPANTAANWFSLDSLPHFEFIEKGKVDTVQSNGTFSLKQTIIVTSFDSGRWAIPVLSFDVGGKSYVTDSLPVSVAYSNFNPEQDYHDIKDILEVENPATKYINWVLAAITILSLIAVIYFLKKSRIIAPATVKETAMLNALEEAILSLEQLKKENLPDKGEVKVYYTRLINIMRQFIWRKSGLRTMEKTSEEVLLYLKENNFPHEALLSLAQTLRMGDAVKFARYIPQQQDNEKCFETTKTSVEILNNSYTSVI